MHRFLIKKVNFQTSKSAGGNEPLPEYAGNHVPQRLRILPAQNQQKGFSQGKSVFRESILMTILFPTLRGV